MSEPYQLQCDAIRQRILAGDNLEVLFTVSAAIAVTQAAADTALTGSAHAAGPTGQDPTLDSSQSLPESAWCGRPPTPEEARDAEHRRREDEIAWESSATRADSSRKPGSTGRPRAQIASRRGTV